MIGILGSLTDAVTIVELIEVICSQALLRHVINVFHELKRLHGSVSSFEALCRMVAADVGVGVLPASVAARLAGSHAIHIIALRDPWAVRELKICVQSLPRLPSFARELVDYLVLNSDPGCRK